MAQAAIAVRAKSAEAFRTISEVADDLDVPQHVLRFWEARFSQIRPVKRAGGRRYYRPDDIDLLRGIKTLLYTEGFTIKGVQKVLRDRGLKHVMAIGQGKTAHAPVPPSAPPPPAEPVAETRVTPFRPRVVKPKPAPVRALDQFDMFTGSPSEKVVAKIEGAHEPKPAAKTAAAMRAEPVADKLAGQERQRLETLLDELLHLKTQLKNRPGQG
jgi:DNA-binding transcriptional MerR regulator